MDISLTHGPDGKPLAHRPDCPQVQAERAAERMVMTLFDCAADLDELTCAKHRCLLEEGTIDR